MKYQWHNNSVKKQKQKKERTSIISLAVIRCIGYIEKRSIASIGEENSHSLCIAILICMLHVCIYRARRSTCTSAGCRRTRSRTWAAPGSGSAWGSCCSSYRPTTTRRATAAASARRRSASCASLPARGSARLSAEVRPVRYDLFSSISLLFYLPLLLLFSYTLPSSVRVHAPTSERARPVPVDSRLPRCCERRDRWGRWSFIGGRRSTFSRGECWVLMRLLLWWWWFFERAIEFWRRRCNRMSSMFCRWNIIYLLGRRNVIGLRDCCPIILQRIVSENNCDILYTWL